MPSLVPELVNMASDPNVSSGDLLRRALVVARRLAVPELAEWISAELEGYKGKPTPSYRNLNGQPQVLNPYIGYQPLHMSTPEEAEKVSTVKIWQPIPELEKMVLDNSVIRLSYTPELEQDLMNGMETPFTPSLALSNAHIHGIVEKVKTRILDWALDLEKKGIIGDGMSFTLQEKQSVQEQHYHINNVSGSQIQIGSIGNQTQTNTTGNDLEVLKGLVQALASIFESLQGETAEELKADLAALKAMTESPKPKWEIIKSAVRSIKNVAEGMTGNILAGLAQSHMMTLIKLAVS